MSRIFITGGTGFIGRGTVRLLSEHNECMVLTRRDTWLLRSPCLPQAARSPDGGNDAVEKDSVRYVTGEVGDRERISALLHEFKPDTLVHLAWDVKAADFSRSPDNEKWVGWSTALAEAFLQCGGRNVIASGTCFEYGWSDSGVLKEDSALRPDTFYGECKVRTYDALKALCSRYGARFVWGRVFYPYGTGEEKRKLFSAAIDALRQGKVFECRTPENRIDYIHVADVSSSFAALAASGDANGVYNICTGRAVRVADMLGYLARKMGKEDNLHLLKQDNSMYVAGDNTALLNAGVNLRYADVYSGLGTYFAWGGDYRNVRFAHHQNTLSAYLRGAASVSTPWRLNPEAAA